MGERESVLSGDRDEHGSPFGWGGVAVLVAIVAWMTFGPFHPTWLYFLGCGVTLAAASGIARLLRRRGRARRWTGRMPSPGRLVAGLLGLGPESWLLAPRWARVRMAAGGFLMFATIAGIMGWGAGQEYQTLQNLREQGRRTEATVVEIASRSEEGSATSLTVRFDTPSGPVRSDVDVADTSTTDAKPGGHIPVVYDPANPTEVRHVDNLDGREADGIRLGSVVVGLLAAGFLVGTTREVVRAKRQTEGGTTQGTTT
ncbi:DUF3592 domain-containing protein [Streptomyces phyllanthi]|uniref:DUF3592 domain-containing protein n=2 Tax=Streptomyces phyllanthi TaxID=1803180 RepID=A0A5N8W8E2_9ACTN|nr:DUF3592 domain-containing protein [Streptomyces phyllanthi]